MVSVRGGGERISPGRRTLADRGREVRGESLSFLVPGGGEVWRQWRPHLGSSGVLSLTRVRCSRKWWRPLVIASGGLWARCSRSGGDP